MVRGEEAIVLNKRTIEHLNAKYCTSTSSVAA